MKATFDVYNVLNIVLNTEVKPINAEESVLVNWDRRHKLAKEALFSALFSIQLLCVSHLDSAHDIWQWLKDEYGQISELKYAQLNAKFKSH